MKEKRIRRIKEIWRNASRAALQFQEATEDATFAMKQFSATLLKANAVSRGKLLKLLQEQ